MKKKNTNEFKDKFTGERLSLYPTPFRALSQKNLRTNDDSKLEKQKEKFTERYLCPLCKKPRTWIKDTNIMSCTNVECQGFPVVNSDGEIIGYRSSWKLLSTRGEEIASTLFTE